MKKIKEGTKVTTKTEDIWYCSRCEISSFTSGRMCPCPRGDCEAKVIGEVTKEMKRTIKLHK